MCGDALAPRYGQITAHNGLVDKNPNDRDIATESFRLVSEAYECLSDSSKRAYYDGKIYILVAAHWNRIWNKRACCSRNP